MASLLFGLPPLAPDYSGVASALHDLGALVVIHDASGCTGTYTGYDEPRWFGSSSPIFCSGLREMDAILGDDEKLLRKICGFVAETSAPFIAIVGSPVPMLVGFDFEGFASLVELETGVPVLAFSTNGLHYYDEGLSAALLKLHERFCSSSLSVLPNTVNLLGASPMDGFDAVALAALKRLAQEAGLQVRSIWGRESSISELKQANSASCNWVLSRAGLPLARRMKETLNIPYVCGLPIGTAETERLLLSLQAAGTGRIDQAESFVYPKPDASHSGEGLRALILADRVRAASLRAFLVNEGIFSSVCIGGFFADDAALREEGDFLFQNEDAARDILARGWDLVLGDSLYKALLPAGFKTTDFVEMPHAAVSGRLFTDSCAHLCVRGIPLLFESLTAVSSSRM